MSGGEGDKLSISPAFEEQVKFLRKTRAKGTTRFQKTTEFNVARKLKKELNKSEPELDQSLVDQRLEASINREAGKSLFESSLIATVMGKELSPERDSIFDEAPPVEPAKANQGTVQKTVQVPVPSLPDDDESVDDEVESGSEYEDLHASSQSTDIFPPASENATSQVIQQTGTPSQAVPPKTSHGRSFFELTREVPIHVLSERLDSKPEIEAGQQSGSTGQESAPLDFERETGHEEQPGATDLQEAADKQFKSDHPGLESDKVRDGDDTISGAEEIPCSMVEAPQQYEAFVEPVQSCGSEYESLQEQQAQYSELNEEMQANLAHQEFVQTYTLRAVKFKYDTGLDILLDEQSNLHLFLNAGGENVSLYSVDYTDEGLEEAAAFAEVLVGSYLGVLSEDFGIEFASPGEMIIKQLEPNSEDQLVPGEKLYARAPRLDELKALHRAIEYSWPATFQLSDQLPLRIVFLNGTVIKDEPDGVVLKFLEDGRPVLFITPELCKHGVPTEDDPIGNDPHESWQASIMRELSWKSAADCERFPLSPEEIASLGWVVLGDGEENPVYALKSARGDLYVAYEDASEPAQAWVRCNAKGEAVDEKGNPTVEVLDMIFLSSHELSKIAEVSRCGDHFFTPEEELVDALRAFRQGAEWRSRLGRSNHNLYRMAKALDQQSINRCYQPTSDYPGLIRSPKGALIDNTPVNQKEVQQFEQKLAKKS